MTDCVVLGLDVSTACTGWSLLDDEGNLVDQGFILLSPHKSVFKKAAVVKGVLEEIRCAHSVGNIFIEENLQSFRRGFSSAKTLSTLARFNGIVSLLTYQVFSIEPEYINVNSARRSLGIRIKREKVCGISTKGQVLSWVREQIIRTSFEWPTKRLKSGPRKGQCIEDPCCYDIADAYVIARNGVLLVQSDNGN